MPTFAHPLGDRIDPEEVVICTIHGNANSYRGEFARRYSWPELQIRQLREHTPPGYHVMAFGNAIIPEHERFLRGCAEVIYTSHQEVTNCDHHWRVWPIRNWLSSQAAKRFRWIVHLDSDAFPVRDDWLPRYVNAISDEHPVVSIQRLENGDTFSDRCFLMFSGDGYKQYRFDFSPLGVTDAGGGISAQLEEEGRAWHKLLRSNRHDYHPLIGGIYDDRIYHHAAGSRLPRFRSNAQIMSNDARTAEQLRENAIHRVLLKRLFEHTAAFLAELRGTASPAILDDDLEREISVLKETLV